MTVQICEYVPCSKEFTAVPSDKRKFCSAPCWDNARRGVDLVDDPVREKLLYSIWSAIKYRCHNETSPAYKWYGARGIKVCKEWINNFRVFESWALSHGYKEGLTMDRKNNDKDYSPGNCRFVNRTAQARNRRGNLLLTAFDETKTVAEWEEDP